MLKPPLYMKVLVIVREEDEESDYISNEYVVNFSSTDAKLWLTKLLTWAMYNSKIIELSCVKDITNVHIYNPQQTAA